MRTFDVPTFYQSPIIGRVKNQRRSLDPRKRDLAPSTIDFGPVRFLLARHFGFCYGVENAIDIAYRALDEHPDQRIFLLSEMIHNPHVNADLQARGMQFLRTTSGEQLIPFDTLTPDDVVIVPAFGATREVMARIEAAGIDPLMWNTTCPFVEKVWKKSAQIGSKDYSIVVHGKRYHEETRATFSQAQQHAPVVVVRDLDEARRLGQVIADERDAAFFFEHFDGRYSDGFDPTRDLRRIGVVNQTTMLATETQAIADHLRGVMRARYGEADLKAHFADTSDTLCYATNENQNATLALIEHGGDLALVVGGYNSSNTSHLVELCAEQMPAYFIDSDDEIVSQDVIQHFLPHEKEIVRTSGWLPSDRPLDIVLTAGASCPDALLERVLLRVLDFFPNARAVEEALAPFDAAPA
jgi:4-hydroxy-3-methylbut-2-enyl diphosphate reductase